MRRNLLVAALFIAALILTFAQSTMAHAATVTQEGPIPESGFIALSCPAGELFVSGTVTFYRDQHATKKPLATVPLEESDSGSRGITLNIPEGARWYSATMECAPPPQSVVYLDQTVTLEPGQETLIECPKGFELDVSTLTISNPELVIVAQGTAGARLYNPTSTTQTAQVTATCNLWMGTAS